MGPTPEFSEIVTWARPLGVSLVPPTEPTLVGPIITWLPDTSPPASRKFNRSVYDEPLVVSRTATTITARATTAVTRAIMRNAPALALRTTHSLSHRVAPLRPRQGRYCQKLGPPAT